MLKEKMFVRCSIDPETENPRYFALGKIESIDTLSEMAVVSFFDVSGVSKYYHIPDQSKVSVNTLLHVKISQNALVRYQNNLFVVEAAALNKEDGFYYYYLSNRNNNTIKVPETDLEATFVDFETPVQSQLKTYEFQNPMWFLGRCAVSKSMQTINNSLYGFKELAGCKISLKPYQLKTVMRCLQGKKCRAMIADEVGLGKTIEAISTLKVYLNDKKDQSVLLIVPSPLVEQWKTELAFKFKIFEGENQNNNRIEIKTTQELPLIKQKYDFIIADEVHRVLSSEVLYQALLRLSETSDNIIMLSATPIQKRKEEYQKLLTLIQPQKYGSVSKDDFDKLLEIQGSIVRKVHDALECLDSYQEELEQSNGEKNDDVKDVFEEVIESLEDIQERIQNETFSQLIEEISIDSNDQGIGAIQTAISFVCEHYQLEKSIIRNRRIVLQNDIQNIRTLQEIPFELQTNFNNDQYQVYQYLADVISNQENISDQDADVYMNLIFAFFSSAAAFWAELESASLDEVPEELINYAKAWVKDETNILKNIQELLDDPAEYESRPVNIVDYIDQNINLKKILVFTDYQATFEYYQKLFDKAFPGECAFFSKVMDQEELESNAYRFQNDEHCRILLSDKTGGEGRNFQNANAVFHIDIPKSANDLEQRIGRLDRIGRKEGVPVLSIVTYAKSTIEEDLFAVWSNGLKMFTKSQSGLEIIMNEIDQKIKDSIIHDFKYGLQSVAPDLIEMISDLEKIVKRESYFDLAAYQYQTLNQMLEKNVDLFSKNEVGYFRDSMLSWANLAGFVATRQDDDVVRFTASSFSLNSAFNSMFVPPDMKGIIDSQMNQMQNHVRQLNNKAHRDMDTNYIEGTFDRVKALKNDYIHFFAPGDEIFDSITNNAVASYKGTCAAMMMNADFNWSGFILTYIVSVDSNKLMENDILPHEIDQYRGFLPQEQFIVAIPLAETSHTEDEVLRIFRSMVSRSATEQKKIIHLGSRHGSSAYIDAFKKAYPKEKWESLIFKVNKKAMELAKEKIKVRFNKQLRMLKNELSSQVSAAKATAVYYGYELDEDNLSAKNDKIYQIIASPKIKLDSACYLRLNRYD